MFIDRTNERRIGLIIIYNFFFLKGSSLFSSFPPSDFLFYFSSVIR